MDPHLLVTHWERVRLGTLATLDLFLEDELSFAPVEGGYSIREIALHVAHEEEIEILHGLAKLDPDVPEPYPSGQFPSKESVGAQLAGVHARSRAYLEGLAPNAWEQEVLLAWGEALRPTDVVLHVIEHETHHRGELSLALGLLGRRGFDA